MKFRLAGPFVVVAGLFGAAGVGGAALAAHGGDTRLVAIAAAILLVHAPALLGIAAGCALRLRFAGSAGVLMTLGVLLFSGDLGSRALSGGRLFIDAAPTGGILMIAGWLALSAAGISAIRGQVAVRQVEGDGRIDR